MALPSHHTTASTRPTDLARLRKLGKAANHVALGALLRAHDLLGLAAGRHLREARAQADPVRHLHARLEKAELKARLAWQVVDLLRARLAKIPERNRPYYSPAQRFQILELRRLLGWTRAEAASALMVCPNTIGNWEAQVQPRSSPRLRSSASPTPSEAWSRR